jgi:amino acid permease
MVGGGSLSLPMAFQKTGNGLLAPLLLVAIAIITDFCFRIHVRSARILSPVSRQKGKDAFESVTAAAFGSNARWLGMILVCSMCFFGTVGYAVLLRDMLQPITNSIWRSTSRQSGPTAHNNLTMLMVVFVVTPLCAIKNLTALEKFGALSMCSILILGSCIVYRSVQCNLGLGMYHPETEFMTLLLQQFKNATDDESTVAQNDWPSFQLFPDSWTNVLDAFPLFVSCFVCHYNLLPVHNELRNPTEERVNWWLRSTTVVATAFYLVIGTAGSAYGHCTKNGQVQGNVLLDFSDDDPLLLVGRMCLAVTITLAFPMLTIPARDILLRSVSSCGKKRTGTESSTFDDSEGLQEPLLENEHALDAEEGVVLLEGHAVNNSTHVLHEDASFLTRLAAAVVCLYSAVAIACCVKSIDVVWDLLGSSLSCLLSYLIPCGSFLVIAKRSGDQDRFTYGVAKLILSVFLPLMVVSTLNAVRHTFF